MVHAIDFYFCKSKRVTPSGKHQIPSIEVQMGSEINDKTRIPIVWVFVFIGFFMTLCCGIIGGAVLYVTDIKTNQAVDSVRISNLDTRVNSLESSWSGALQEIKRDLKDLANYVNERERVEKASRSGHK